MDSLSEVLMVLVSRESLPEYAYLFFWLVWAAFKQRIPPEVGGNKAQEVGVEGW